MINTELIFSERGIRVYALTNTDALDELEKKMSELESALNKTIYDLGEEAKNLWIKNATGRLKDSAGYIKAIEQGVNSGNLEYTIDPKFKQTEHGKDVGILMEYGFEAFDMKAKVNHRVIVKFDYGIPGSNSPAEMNNKIYEKAQKHNMFQSYPLTKQTVPELFNNNDYSNKYNPAKLKSIDIRNPNPINFPNHNITQGQQNLQGGYQWQTRQYKGLKANEKTPLKVVYSKKPQFRRDHPTKITVKGAVVSKMSLFRTLSPIPPKNAPADWNFSWIHPGVEPKNIFRDMISEMDNKSKSVIQNTIKQILEQ